MKYKTHILLLSFLFMLLYSCIEGNHKLDTETIPVSREKGIVEFKIPKDTVFIDEYARGLAYLAKPYFSMGEPKIIVFVEDGEISSLKSDLSNLTAIDFLLYPNLDIDTINQRWFPEYKTEYERTVAFGKKYETAGRKKIRGYIMEYISEYPPLDTILDENKTRKYFFEKSIYVIGSTY